MDSDRELVLALRARAPGAFEQLYARCRAPVWRFLCRLSGAAVEDLFQETWLAAARHVHRIREDTALLPWLFTIARNKHKNGLRGWARQGRCARALREQQVAVSARPDEDAEVRQLALRTRAAFASLPAPHREVLWLCVGEGFDTSEAARVLACSEDAVRKRLSRARRDLARLSGRDESGGDES